ncbi:MAG: redoxin domain-containing protein [Chloroflexi bacterium]|nr:redoxin domain-containing protein [Chloroflexota bacterium]
MPKWFDIKVVSPTEAEGGAKTRQAGRDTDQIRSREAASPISPSQTKSPAPYLWLTGILIVGLIIGAIALGLYVTRSQNNTSAPANTAPRSGLSIAGIKADFAGLPDTVATVNGEKISGQDYANEVRLNLAIYPLAAQPNSPPLDDIGVRQIQQRVLEEMINKAIGLQKAQQSGITATNQEADAEIARILKNLAVGDQQLDQALTSQDINRDIIRKFYRERVIVQRYISTVLAQGKSQQDTKTIYDNWLIAERTNAKVEVFTFNRGVSTDVGLPPGVVARINAPAPTFTLTTPSGGKVSLKDYAGKPIMLNFWATWCPPCQAEMPFIQFAAQQFQDTGLSIIGIDLQEDPVLVSQYISRLNLTFPSLIDITGQVSNAYQVRALPTSIFINKDGVIVDIHRGQLNATQLQNYLDKILSTE